MKKFAGEYSTVFFWLRGVLGRSAMPFSPNDGCTMTEARLIEKGGWTFKTIQIKDVTSFCFVLGPY
jgi:hypothetical protein